LTTKDEALKMARKAKETGNLQDLIDAVNALMEALEQPSQEPMCFGVLDGKDVVSTYPTEKIALEICQGLTDDYQYMTGQLKAIPLYTHPHQFIGLTDDEIGLMISKLDIAGEQEKMISNFARAIEAKLKEKNT